MRDILYIWFTNSIYESLDILQGIVDITHESRILCVIYCIYESRTLCMSHELYASPFLYVCHELTCSYCNVGCGSCGESWILRVTNTARDSVQVISLSVRDSCIECERYLEYPRLTNSRTLCMSHEIIFSYHRSEHRLRLDCVRRGSCTLQALCTSYELYVWVTNWHTHTTGVSTDWVSIVSVVEVVVSHELYPSSALHTSPELFVSPTLYTSHKTTVCITNSIHESPTDILILQEWAQLKSRLFLL